MRFNRRYYKHLELPYADRHIPKYQKKYGVWRWRGMAEYKDTILPLITGRTLDFGGALAPLGFGADVVDTLEFDIHMHEVPFHSLAEVPYIANTVFTSHTLEHVPDLVKTVGMMLTKLKSGGYLIAHVPSIKGMKFWHPRNETEHNRIFKLSTDSTVNDTAIVSIDTVFEQLGLTVDIAEYCGDECLMIIARK